MTNGTRWTRRLVLVAALALGFALASWLQSSQRSRRVPDVQALLDDPELRAELVAWLARESAGIWDSHNDPDVGRVLLPRLAGHVTEGQITVDSNLFGMREHPYALPKPAGLLRVVVLGASLVYGLGCPAEERLGVHLERFLRTRAGGPEPALEVLHIAIGGWNLVAECAYLRRQLALLQPDLVLHVSAHNALDDVEGARGFGGKGRFTNRFRERTDVTLTTLAGARLGMIGYSPLTWGLEYEGRERYAEARARLAELVRLVEQQGGRYLMLLHWGPMSAAAGRHLVPVLRPEQVAALPLAFFERSDVRLAPENLHWNPAGMRLVAELLYGLIRARNLLALELPPSPAAEEMLALVAQDGATELTGDPEVLWR
jgi:hypothetical protein